MKKYKDKDWLISKYLQERLSQKQIAKLENYNILTIRHQLEKFNIPIRSAGETKHLNNMKRIGNDNYCKKDWLKKRYLEERLSLYQIAELCNCSHTTIQYWLRKLNIPIYSTSEVLHLRQGNHCNLSKEAKQWIDGELLGDGSLYSCSQYSSSFQYSSKYLEYINYISDTLKSFGIKQSGKIHKIKDSRWGCYSYKYGSLNYVELLPIRKRWYPGGKKIIPKDLKLTPLMLRQEHIGDGCLQHYNRGRQAIKLATCGFTIDDVNWLVKKLNDLGFRSTRAPSDNTIHISTYSTEDFLDYIGDCPVKCYQYKFDYLGRMNHGKN